MSPITNIQKEFEISPGTVDTVYSVQTKIPEEVLFTGTEVISSIYKLNLDGITVKVNGITFSTPKDVKEKAISHFEVCQLLTNHYIRY
ncbi:hypothetical protein OL548_34425 (plasmid) [Lysinibacillus sp. MHQ-1]|nr:hypothetical protein OL548_34425 [Lysinibacillus sp. MHQ-1]